MFKSIGIFKALGVQPLGQTSHEFKTISLKGSYFETYRCAIQNLDYDVLLVDDSILQFSCTASDIPVLPKLRYAFFPNPQLHFTYEEYLSDIVSATYEEAGDTFLEDYQQALSEAELNSFVTPMRYDLDKQTYAANIHATSHIHIGSSEHVRIPANKVLSPISFAYFILKHQYYTHWKRLSHDTERFRGSVIQNVKKHCVPVDKNYWDNETESLELFLS